MLFYSVFLQLQTVELKVGQVHALEPVEHASNIKVLSILNRVTKVKERKASHHLR